MRTYSKPKTRTVTFIEFAREPLLIKYTQNVNFYISAIVERFRRL